MGWHGRKKKTSWKKNKTENSLSSRWKDYKFSFRFLLHTHFNKSYFFKKMLRKFAKNKNWAFSYFFLFFFFAYLTKTHTHTKHFTFYSGFFFFLLFDKTTKGFPCSAMTSPSLIWTIPVDANRVINPSFYLFIIILEIFLFISGIKLKKKIGMLEQQNYCLTPLCSPCYPKWEISIKPVKATT